MNSEILNAFDESRNEFRPYGLTCELWTPNLMRKPDRHNEIELNYFCNESMTYLFHGNKITIPANRLTIFWGLIPHQIVYHEGMSPYFVCTIPFSQFLEWNLPASFVDRVLRGEVLYEASEESSAFDAFLLKNWIRDIHNPDSLKVILLEMQARMSRMAIDNLSWKAKDQPHIPSKESTQVESIAIYIAQNYDKPIQVSDIGAAVGLHPDYANSIFKKAFGTTLNNYIIGERVAHAQRKLVATDKKITEIAFECGFNSISRFNAAFLKINFCTPRAFRKRYQ